MPLDIEYKKLEGTDIDQVSAFSLADPDDAPLRIYIRSKARKSANANITQTYVAKIAGTPRVIGYITISCAEIALGDAYPIEDNPDANRYVYQPAIRIARLAVDDRNRKIGIGENLLSIVMAVVKDQIMPHVGCRFIILDAKRKSINFYKKYGFQELRTPNNENQVSPVMFLDTKNF